MKFTVSLAAASLLVVAGCSNSNKPSASLQPNSSVSQLTPTPSAPTEYVAPAPEPVAAAAPLDTSTPTMASDVSYGPTASATGGKYTIKPGDTFYRIALNHYGDAKQWKKIAAANPEVAPTHLRVGQTIILP